MTVQNNEYVVRLIDLPCAVKAVTALDDEGLANIYLNAKLSQETQRKALKHELNHLDRDDFYNDLDIRTVEGA